MSTKAIVFTQLKYGDTSLIVKAYTASDGIKSYLLKGILSARKGKVKAALFQPLTQLELTAQHKNKGTLEHIKEAKVYYQYQSLHTHIVKNAMSFFLAEMLANSIYEEEPNTKLFNFIESALQWLDLNSNSANFHLYFLIHLTKYLGFYPDSQHIANLYFDLLEGQFIDKPSLNPLLEGEELSYFKQFLGINFDTLHTIKLKKEHRNKLLKALVVYYQLHLQGFRSPKSLIILNEVFS